MSHDLRTPCCQSGSPPGIALHQALLVFPKRVLPIFSSRHYVKRGDNVTPVHAIIQTLFSTSLRNKCTYRYSTSCLYFIDCLKNNKTLELSDLNVFTSHPWQCFFSFPSSSPVIQFFEGPKPDFTRSWLYGLCSLSYVGAMVSSNSALQYVNYPTQVSPKSLSCPGNMH